MGRRYIDPGQACEVCGTRRFEVVDDSRDDSPVVCPDCSVRIGCWGQLRAFARTNNDARGDDMAGGT